MTAYLDTLAAGGVNLQVYTTPHATSQLDPEPALVALIKKAKTSLYFAAYGFTLPSVAQAIIDAHLRGVAVMGVLDAGQLTSKNSQAHVLVAAGVPVKQWGSQYNLNHEKVVVIDPDTVNTNCAVGLGSYNWTTSAEHANREVFVVLSGIQVSRVAGPVFRDQIKDTYSKGRDVPSPQPA